MTTLTSPLGGTLRPLSDVPDAVFARGALGPGVAVDPTGEGEVTVVSPLAGTIAKLFPHAFVVSAGPLQVLVHLGIDTVKFHGEGFCLLAAEGDEVQQGTPVVRWNPSAVEQAGRSAICPVVVMGTEPDQVHVAGELGTPVATQQDLLLLD